LVHEYLYAPEDLAIIIVKRLLLLLQVCTLI
jgi:hypothetical protein